MKKKLNLFSLLLFVVISILFVSGCSGNVAKGGKKTYNYNIAVVTHGTANDTFWNDVKKGSDKAAADYGIHLNFYFTDNNTLQQSNIIKSEGIKNTQGVATTLADPIPLKNSLDILEKKHIPVVSFNSGLSVYKQYGTLTHIGQDDYIAGKELGEAILKENQNLKPLCIIHEANNISLQQRCKGLKDALGNIDILELNNKNSDYISKTVFSYLMSHPQINYLTSLSVPVTQSILDMLKQNHINTPVAGFDSSKELLQALKDYPQLQFIVDQQPFLQGYLSVEALVLYLYNKSILGGGDPVYTGPKIISKKTV